MRSWNCGRKQVASRVSPHKAAEKSEIQTDRRLNSSWSPAMKSPSLQKTRRSVGGVEECPSPVNIDTPQKTKKKKKQVEKESHLFLSDADGTPNQKKMKRKEQEEEGSQNALVTSETEMKKKKKRRKEQEEEGSQVEMETSETEIKKKKKKRRKEQEEEEESGVDMETSGGEKMSKKKRRKEQEEEGSQVDTETSDAEKKKKKRKEQGEEGSQVDVETCETETKKKKKKKKRRKEQEEGVSQQDVGTSTEKKMWIKEEEEGSTNNEAGQKKKNKRKEQEEEESGVDVEASGREKMSKKKKKRRKEQEEEGSQVDKENNDGEKKKKKKKRKEQEEEGSQVDMETNDAGMNREENNRLGYECATTATTDKDDISEVLLEELKEFVPDADKKSINEINRLLRDDLDRFRAFRKQGISLRQGRFTPEENQRIRDNIENFLALTDISSANHLLFPYRFKEQEAMIKKLKVQHHFTERLAEGIPRPSKKVYNRAIKLFDETNHMGRFSKEELKSLMKFQSIHGNNWKLISRKMDRSFYSLEKRFSDIASNHGHWSPDEESRLKQVIRGHLEVLAQRNPAGSGLTRRQLCNKLPWTKISQHVETRSWTQCRLKWFSLLRLRLTSQENVNRSAGGLKFKIRLINTLYNQNVDSMADIRWDTVTEIVGDATSVCAQKCFHRLKVSKVPNWTSLSYGEIIDFLWANVIPDFQEKLAAISEKEEQEEEQQEEPQEGAQEGAEQEPTFLLSDIFSSLDEDFS